MQPTPPPEDRSPAEQGEDSFPTEVTAAAGRLIRDDPAWRYWGLHATFSVRRLRVWQSVDGGLVAVVSECPDDGSDGSTSLANAGEQVIAQLQAEYGPDVEVIEHQLPWRPARSEGSDRAWGLTGLRVGGDTVPDGVDYVELSPVPHLMPGSLERVLLDARGQATWWPVTPTDLTRRLAGGPW